MTSFPGAVNLDRLGRFLSRIVDMHFLLEENQWFFFFGGY